MIQLLDTLWGVGGVGLPPRGIGQKQDAGSGRRPAGPPKFGRGWGNGPKGRENTRAGRREENFGILGAVLRC